MLTRKSFLKAELNSGMISRLSGRDVATESGSVFESLSAAQSEDALVTDLASSEDILVESDTGFPFASVIYFVFGTPQRVYGPSSTKRKVLLFQLLRSSARPLLALCYLAHIVGVLILRFNQFSCGTGQFVFNLSVKGWDNNISLYPEVISSLQTKGLSKGQTLERKFLACKQNTSRQALTEGNVIDQILGVRALAVAALRRLLPTASNPRASIYSIPDTHSVSFLAAVMPSRASFQAAYSVFGLTIDSIATRAYSFLSKRAFDAYSFLNKGKKKRAKTSTAPVTEKAPTPSPFSEIAAETASYIAPRPSPSSGTEIATSPRLAYD
ncbi:hypothetical protein Syun_031847 [Stephania yunnanensis]|uniref:Uncharacterized protein n=1 Tax=Stephania yunnanensis TaxID=152371 RepID=A0AAP0HBV6_9MAGN